MTVYSARKWVGGSAVGMNYWSASVNDPTTARSGAMYPDSGLTYRTGASPHYERPTWYKCPFCGHRQNIDKDGAHCKTCNGDIMDTNVK